MLREAATDGFPTDYVVARIKGRQAALISDWEPVIDRTIPSEGSDEAIWERFLREMAWLHAQMNANLRETFTPLFALFEIKTIVLCLRNKAVLRSGEVQRLLKRSLLSAEIQEILLRPIDLQSTMQALERATGAAANDDGNLANFENSLMRTWLRNVIATRLDPVLQTFFTSFIDLRNVMLLYKELRWGVKRRIPFIAGGSIEPSRLEEIIAKRDNAALDALVRTVADPRTVSVASTEGALETVLLRSLTRRVATLRRAGDAGLIVAYIWRTYVQTRNLAVLHHAAAVDRETLERELIL